MSEQLKPKVCTLFIEFDNVRDARHFAYSIEERCPDFKGWHINPGSIMFPALGQRALELLTEMIRDDVSRIGKYRNEIDALLKEVDET